jgi:NAD(P)-dependent dehydrogenase (short-subunit alcohol dehydrogenase family)
MLLSGKVAVITGSAVGIGRGLARAFAEQGGDVALLDIDAPANLETARQASAFGVRALPLDCDIADASQVRSAFARILEELGPVDVLVNNAAIYVDTSLTRGTFASQSEAYARSIAVCALGGYYCTLAAVPSMRENGGGSVINLITEHIKEGHMMAGLGASGYDAAKWVQWRQTESWAVELEPYQIRVNALGPGATDTPMLRAVSVPHAEKGMKPEDVAEAALNIIRQGADGPTGQTYIFGISGEPRETGRRQAEEILRRTSGDRIP